MSRPESGPSPIALVTGGAGGLGAAIARALAADGARIVVAYHRDAGGAAALVHDLGAENALALQGDLDNPATPVALVEATVARFGGLSIVVNNAGEMTDGRVEDLGDATWDRALEVNLSSAFRLCRAAIPALRQAETARIVNVSSQAAFRGSAAHAHYSAAKAGLLGLTYSLARELGADAITVNAVVPGRFATGMLHERMDGREDEWRAQTPLGRLGDPAELAAVVAFLASPAASYVTGAAIQVGGGLVMG